MADSKIGRHIANGGRLWGPAPTYDFSGRFSEITSLRRLHYRESLPERSPEEVEAFIGRMGSNEFVNPQRVARPGAMRTMPVAAAALDSHGQILAIAHGYNEVSSSLPGPLSKLDRARKMHFVPAKHYFAINEVVHDGEHDELATAVTGLILSGVDGERTATWYPYDEEEALINSLEELGLSPDLYPVDWPTPEQRGEPVTEDKFVFGDDAAPAIQERWTAKIADMRNNIQNLLAE